MSQCAPLAASAGLMGSLVDIGLPEALVFDDVALRKRAEIAMRENKSAKGFLLRLTETPHPRRSPCDRDRGHAFSGPSVALVALPGGPCAAD